MTAGRGPAFPHVSTPRDGALDPDRARASAATGNHSGHGLVAARMFHVEHGNMRPRRAKPAAWADHERVKPTTSGSSRQRSHAPGVVPIRVRLAGEPENASRQSERTRPRRRWGLLVERAKARDRRGGRQGVACLHRCVVRRSGHSVPRRESIGLRLACCRPAKPRTQLNSRRDGRRPCVCHRCAKEVT